MNVSQAMSFPLTVPNPAAPKEQPFDRALAVVDAVTRAARPVSVTDIASECGLPVPTVHRLVAQLEKRGLLKRVLGSKKLVVGFGLVRLGIAALEAALRTDRPHQILLAFANHIGEHCQIGLRSENAVLYIDTAQAVRSRGLHFEQGRRSPLHCTSIGKLYLAEMSDAEFDWWLSHAPLESLAPRTIVSPAVLRTVVRNVKKHGWAMSNQEIAAGVVGCAVPIRDFEGRLLAGLGLSVPSARVSFEELSQFRPAMASAAAEIAAAVSAEN
jgi:IclR family transcriptional regulator, acetate operon repressor